MALAMPSRKSAAEANRGATCWRGDVRCRKYAENWLDERKFSCECSGYEPEERETKTRPAISMTLTGHRIML